MYQRKSVQIQDETLLRMALVGYESELEKTQVKIAEIQTLLGGSSNGKRPYNRKATGVSVGEVEQPTKKRFVSAAARKKMAKAQKKRWALKKLQNA
jgi:hypothetical protein